jgi:adenosylmethionine-8-amino-7-oxononanoate aminotransferase
VHGFTYSHSVVGAAVAHEVLRILDGERLVDASAVTGDRLRARLDERLAGLDAVGEIRGRGLLLGLELVADPVTKRPFSRHVRVVEAVVRAARERGVLLYSGTGVADGVDGDVIVLGPPFVITDSEIDRVAEVVAEAIEEALASVVAASSSVSATV